MILFVVPVLVNFDAGHKPSYPRVTINHADNAAPGSGPQNECETCSLQSGTISLTKHKYHEAKLYKKKLETLSRILAAIILLATTKVSRLCQHNPSPS